MMHTLAPESAMGEPSGREVDVAPSGRCVVPMMVIGMSEHEMPWSVSARVGGAAWEMHANGRTYGIGKCVGCESGAGGVAQDTSVEKWSVSTHAR